MDQNIKTVAIDAIRGKITDYSAGETSDKLRNAFIKLNGGSTKINPKTFYRGNDLFALVEDIIPAILDEGIKSDADYLRFVEYKNIADGDLNEFIVKGNDNLVVAKAADGISGIRRQRLGVGDRIAIPTTPHIIRVYDEFSRFLAGQIDFDEMTEAMGRVMQQSMRADALEVLAGITSSTKGLNANYVKSGSFSEATLLELCMRVEAATGKKPFIMGDLLALRKITTAVTGDPVNTDMYNLGHYGKFYSYEMIKAQQMYKPGTETFALDGHTVYVVGADSKFIKQVNEGSGFLDTKSGPIANADETQEVWYMQNFGTGLVINEKIGVYTMS